VRKAGRAILEALAVFARPASTVEIARALDLPRTSVLREIRSLEQVELVTSLGPGSALLFRLGPPGLRDPLRAGVAHGKARRLHLRAARHLRSLRGPGLRDAENLARHLLLSGRKTAGLRQAGLAARRLRRSGRHERAVLLLEEAVAYEPDPRRRFAILEELSSLAEEIGDHEKGLSLLEPFASEALSLLPEPEAVRLRRRLGVHFHRSGRADDAIRTFEAARRAADPRRDIEELIFIDSELAELHTLRGRLDRADAACRQGLERLEALRPGGSFRTRMEVLLLASRGHLELRRLELEEARKAFRSALLLARRPRMAALRAVILANLGITENQLHHLGDARRALREAERLFRSAGERRSLILVASNLAVIAAKLGEREKARVELERAEGLIRRSPGERLEFSVAYARGVVASLLGDMEEAIDSLGRALPLGRRLGDTHLVRFGGVILGEAQMACGRYGAAWSILRTLSREARAGGPPILVRMVQSRLFLLAALLGRVPAAAQARSALERVPRSDLGLLEAWNDLFAGLGRLVLGEPCRPHLEGALAFFRRSGVASGERFARLVLLLEALAAGERSAVKEEAARLGEGGPATHRFLSVAVPLALAEAHSFLGDLEPAREEVGKASGAIIGSPFLELDWRIELLRAHVVLKAGDARGARAHLHRAAHSRDLLQGLVPPRARARFLAHPRFRGLGVLIERLERSPGVVHRTGRAGDACHGMVGQCPEMLQVFGAIERLRHQEIPVLITGETGTGKDLVARALHHESPRARGPFRAIPVASLPIELFESELFGHEKGAFTGAEEARAGLLESLAGGTVLLDGVGDLEPAAQAKLLRVLDSRSARRLGSNEDRPLDVRFLSAAGPDLRRRAASGTFRADLLYRLAPVELSLPPLRARRGDLPLLARHFLEMHSRRLDRAPPRLDQEALDVLEGHPWPGNVRELETVLLRAMVTLSPHAPLGARELKPLLGPAPGAAPAEEDRYFQDLLARNPPLDALKLDVERFYLVHLFRKLRGDPRRMMKVLGWKQSYFYGRLKEVGIDIQRLREECSRGGEGRE
jgi:DNA-binding NtrC family response regulator/tetratricopeptide (TPR) repeat protein